MELFEGKIKVYPEQLHSKIKALVKTKHKPHCLLRDRFIFGSCCRLPGQSSASEWEERANSLPVSQVLKSISTLLALESVLEKAL